MALLCGLRVPDAHRVSVRAHGRAPDAAGDCDTGWHIRTGEWILANHEVPARDIFSFSKPANVVRVGVAVGRGVRVAERPRRPGDGGAVRAFCCCRSPSRCCSGWCCASPTRSWPFVVTWWPRRPLRSIGWPGRTCSPVVPGAVLRGAGARARRAEPVLGVPYLVLLPVATILWTNLHGGFFVGILMIGAYGGGEALLRWCWRATGAERRTAVGRPARLLSDAPRRAWRPASSIRTSTTCTCTCWNICGDPYQRSTSWNSCRSASIIRWRSSSRSCLLAGGGGRVWNLSKGRYTEPLLLLLWAHAALLASRNIPLFVIVAAPLVAAAMEAVADRSCRHWNVADWLEGGCRGSTVGCRRDRGNRELPRWHLVSAAGPAAGGGLIYAPHPPRNFRPEFDPDDLSGRRARDAAAATPRRASSPTTSGATI